MKNKKYKSLNYSSIINDNSNTNFSLNSKKISFQEETKRLSIKHQTNNYKKKQKSRQINSLEELTKKFIKYVLDSESNTINLNTVMKKIKVKKRRIYDITNVLEGKIIYLNNYKFYCYRNWIN